MATEHGVEDHAWAPHVHTLVIGSADEYFRSLERDRTCVGHHFELRKVFFALPISEFRDIKISYFYDLAIAAYEYVVGLQISVADLIIVQVFDTRHDLFKNHRRKTFWISSNSMDHAKHFFGFGKFHHQIYFAALSVYVELINFDNILVIKLSAILELLDDVVNCFVISRFHNFASKLKLVRQAHHPLDQAKAPLSQNLFLSVQLNK